MPVELRECRACHVEKDIEKDYTKKYKTCKECLKKRYEDRRRKDYLDNREERIKISNDIASEWRKKAITILGGPKCVRCGCEVYPLLQINHIDGNGAHDRKVNGMVSGKFWRAVALELVPLSNFEVTCRLCNQLHYITFMLGHGGFKISYKEPYKFRKKLEKIFQPSFIGTIYSKLGVLSKLVSYIF